MLSGIPTTHLEGMTNVTSALRSFSASAGLLARGRMSMHTSPLQLSRTGSTGLVR